MLDFIRIWRAWIEIEGEPSLIVPSVANPKSIRLSSNSLRMEMRRCPELSPVLQGKKFAIQDGTRFVGNFECTLTSQSGTLKVAAGDRSCSIDENDLLNASFTAYCQPDPENSGTILIDVVQQIAGTSQIVIHSGGKITASSNLVGKTVKVRVVYPEVVVQSDEAIATIKAHLVGLWDDDTIRYVAIGGCQMNADNGMGINLRFSESNVQNTVLEV